MMNIVVMICAMIIITEQIKLSWMIVHFFFFQAEDGIRDVAVTGVQTCALPISPVMRSDYDTVSESDRITGAIAGVRAHGYDIVLKLDATIGLAKRDGTTSEDAKQIGRASCRERV